MYPPANTVNHQAKIRYSKIARTVYILAFPLYSTYMYEYITTTQHDVCLLHHPECIYKNIRCDLGFFEILFKVPFEKKKAILICQEVLYE